MPTIGTRGNAAARGYGFTGAGAAFTVTWTPAPAGSPFTTGSYTGVDFTASATVTVSGGNKDVEYVVVAGGGGGGGASSFGHGGGGAGGFRNGTLVGVSPGSYTVTVGGGAGGSYGTYGSPD